MLGGRNTGEDSKGIHLQNTSLIMVLYICDKLPKGKSLGSRTGWEWSTHNKKKPSVSL